MYTTEDYEVPQSQTHRCTCGVHINPEFFPPNTWLICPSCYKKYAVVSTEEGAFTVQRLEIYDVGVHMVCAFTKVSIDCGYVVPRREEGGVQDAE